MLKTQESVGNQAQNKLLQAKWFPLVLSGLALTISIGGHAFTSNNTVNITELINKVTALNDFRDMADEGNSRRDRQIQALRSEQVRQQEVIKALQAELEQAKASSVSSTGSAAALPAASQSLFDEAQRQAAMSRTETEPLANGVNSDFDRSVRRAMKPHYIAPPARQGERVEDDDMVVLQFQVDRSGNIRDVQVANTSGFVEYDNAVVKAALRLQRIPEVASMSVEAYKQIARNFRLAVMPMHLR